MDKLTGAQNGGSPLGDAGKLGEIGGMNGGRRRKSRKSYKGRKGRKGNSWLAHVKATMKLNHGKSFKQILKIAKKTYKRSQSQSQSAYQSGGSGAKVAGVGASASPYV